MSRQKEYVAYHKGEVWKLIKIRTYNCHQKDYYVSNMGRVASKSRNKKGAVMQVLKQYVDKKRAERL